MSLQAGRIRLIINGICVGCLVALAAAVRRTGSSGGTVTAASPVRPGWRRRAWSKHGSALDVSVLSIDQHGLLFSGAPGMLGEIGKGPASTRG